MVENWIPSQSSRNNAPLKRSCAVRPAGLPADFVIGQEVGCVGRQRASVDAAWPEARRPGGVHHLVVVDLLGGVELVGVALFIHVLVEVGAGRTAERDERVSHSASP